MSEEKDFQKQIHNLELKAKGIELEYEYVNELKDRKYRTKYEKMEKQVKENESAIEYYKKEFDEVVKKMEEYKKENELIKNSKWWKLREKIKGGK